MKRPNIFQSSVKSLSDFEYNKCYNTENSWHSTYKNSAYIYIGGLNYGLTEGDIVIVFSQWGEPIDVNLIRDPKTGKSKGFCFLAYEDQQSTILAVDNANDMILLGNKLKVDHVSNYKVKSDSYTPSGAEGGGIGIYGITKDVRLLFEKELKKLNNRNGSIIYNHQSKDNYLTSLLSNQNSIERSRYYRSINHKTRSLSRSRSASPCY
ncbi:RNA recognition family protein [Cryptosporidium andersoni]|uniref:RNA recognition family protein n=1 Tax=Cryptosporidium andersoni TaxID=117008 RepID=A0A1J4MX18_9CRYT|nr:RNA recognition family protein [Cryptosporidium andersoni]